MAIKKFKYASSVGPSKAEYDDSSEAAQGGHPLIRANWKAADSLRGALGLVWSVNDDNELEYGAHWADNNSLEINYDFDSTLTHSETIVVSLDETQYQERYAFYQDQMNWPAPIEFEDLLIQSDDRGDPYFTKFIKTGFSSTDPVVLQTVPSVLTTMGATAYFDYTTNVTYPSAPSNPTPGADFDINIVPVYNTYNRVLEGDTFRDSGLKETAIPNYYMLTYRPPDPFSNTVAMPNAYKQQINLFNEVAWTSGPINEGGATPLLADGSVSIQPDRATDYFNEYQRGIQNIVNNNDATSINNQLARYKVIAVPPSSLNWLKTHSNNENNLRLLPWYNDISFTSPDPGCSTEHPYIRNLLTAGVPNASLTPSALQNTNLFWPTYRFFDYLMAFIVERDQGMASTGAASSLVYLVNADGDAPNLELNIIDTLERLLNFINEGAGIDESLAAYSNIFWDGSSPDTWLRNKIDIGHPNIGPKGTNLISSDTYLKYLDAIADPTQTLSLDDLAPELPTIRTAFAAVLETLKRTHEELLDGREAYSETLAYKIEKRHVDQDGAVSADPVQTFYIPNMDGNFRYIDSQIFYGERYQYNILPIRVVFGNKYGYTNLMVSSDPSVEGRGHALGNALGFYKDTQPGSVLADGQYISNKYLDDYEDTGVATEHQGYFIFKKTDTVQSLRTIETNNPTADLLERLQLKPLDGSGINNNINGGVVPVGTFVHAAEQQGAQAVFAGTGMPGYVPPTPPGGGGTQSGGQPITGLQALPFGGGATLPGAGGAQAGGLLAVPYQGPGGAGGAQTGPTQAGGLIPGVALAPGVPWGPGFTGPPGGTPGPGGAFVDTGEAPSEYDYGPAFGRKAEMDRFVLAGGGPGDEMIGLSGYHGWELPGWTGWYGRYNRIKAALLSVGFHSTFEQHRVDIRTAIVRLVRDVMSLTAARSTPTTPTSAPAYFVQPGLRCSPPEVTYTPGSQIYTPTIGVPYWSPSTTSPTGEWRTRWSACNLLEAQQGPGGAASVAVFHWLTQNPTWEAYWHLVESMSQSTHAAPYSGPFHRKRPFIDPDWAPPGGYDSAGASQYGGTEGAQGSGWETHETVRNQLVGVLWLGSGGGRHSYDPGTSPHPGYGLGNQGQGTSAYAAWNPGNAPSWWGNAPPIDVGNSYDSHGIPEFNS